MVASCVPIPRAGQGVMATASPPQAPTQSRPQHSSPPPLLKPPAGTILEAVLGVTAVSVLVVVSCVIIARKMHAVRAAGLRADASRSSVTVSALPGQEEGREPDVPLSTRTATVHVARDNKMDQPRDVHGRYGSETARQ